MFRLDVFNQPRFHEKSVDLAVGDEIINIGDFADPVAYAAVVA